MAVPLPPISRELTKRGDRVIVRSSHRKTKNGKGAVSSTVKLTANERSYLEWLRRKTAS